MKKEIKFNDGSVYFGSTNSNDERHGKGKLSYTNGESYIGEWKDDKQDGFGIYYNSEGIIVKKGFWEQGVFLKKSEYFDKKEIKELSSKYRKLHYDYVWEKNDAYNDADYEDIEHPFSKDKLPKKIRSDKEFVYSLLKPHTDDEYIEPNIDFLSFLDEKLFDDKEFVIQLFLSVSDNYDAKEKKNEIKGFIPSKLRTDIDVINAAGLNVFSEFGDRILNSKEDILNIIKQSDAKEFYDWESISEKIRSDKDFFMALSKMPKRSQTLEWATKDIKKNKKIISSYLKTAADAIKFVPENIKGYETLVKKALSKKGELILSLNSRFENNITYIKIAAKNYPELILSFNKKIRNNYDVSLICIKQKPELLRYCKTSIKSNKKLLLSLLKQKNKDIYFIKYASQNFFNDKKIFNFIFFHQSYRKFLFKKEDNSEKLSLIYKFNKKFIYNPKNILFLIEKTVNAGYPSSDEVVQFVCDYFNYSKNMNLIRTAIKKSEYYYTGLSKQLREKNELVVLMLQHENMYLYKNLPSKIRKDKNILDLIYKNFIKRNININNVYDHNMLDWELYWYLYDRINKEKLSEEVYNEEDIEIKVADIGFLDSYERYKYTGQIKNGRAHGNGFATNQEFQEDGEHVFIKTYDGEWKDGLPHGTGVYKAYMQDEYPPSGETEVHYQGQFKFGLKDGEGEMYENGRFLFKGYYKKDKLIRKLSS